VVAAGDELVRVNLVAGVPDEAVAGEVKRQVQGQAQLDDAQVAGEVGRADAEDPDQLVPHLLGELGELVVAEFMQIRGRLDRRQDCAHALSSFAGFIDPSAPRSEPGPPGGRRPGPGAANGRWPPGTAVPRGGGSRPRPGNRGRSTYRGRRP